MPAKIPGLDMISKKDDVPSASPEEVNNGIRAKMVKYGYGCCGDRPCVSDQVSGLIPVSALMHVCSSEVSRGDSPGKPVPKAVEPEKRDEKDKKGRPASKPASKQEGVTSADVATFPKGFAGLPGICQVRAPKGSELERIQKILCGAAAARRVVREIIERSKHAA